MISESEVEVYLQDAMELLQEDLGFNGPYTDDIRTFKEDMPMICTHPHGLVILFEDGSEFQVTIKRSALS